jgi:hypothetical protein
VIGRRSTPTGGRGRSAGGLAELVVDGRSASTAWSLRRETSQAAPVDATTQQEEDEQHDEDDEQEFHGSSLPNVSSWETRVGRVHLPIDRAARLLQPFPAIGEGGGVIGGVGYPETFEPWVHHGGWGTRS